MQIIQTIRDKGAAIAVAVIALCLIGFILMDVSQGGGSMFGSLSTNVGKVNGETIEANEFNNRVQMMQAQEERSGQPVSGVRSYQIREQVWNTVVAERIFYAETEKLGITLTPKELSSILLSSDQTNPLMQEQSLLTPDGKLDVAKASQSLAEIKKAKGEQRVLVDNQIINPLVLSTSVAKYTGMLSASAYYPAWMQKKDQNESKEFASITYVTIPYTEIPDSSVTVTDAEINDYVKKNKDLFKQDAGRMISYVAFSQMPNKEDSLRAMAQVEEMKSQFAADTTPGQFIARNASMIPFDDNFKSKEKFANPRIDSIIAAPAGTVYGPYIDGKNYVLAKVVGSKQMPDSASARHILIQTYDPQSQTQKKPDSIAKPLADSILAALNSGANFDALVTKYSDDQGSVAKGGKYENFAYEAMVPEFSEFAYTKSPGSKGIVKTVFGYHIMEALGQKAIKPAYKIAFFAREIVAGDATVNQANLQATKASVVKSSKELADFAKANGYQITDVPSVIKENDYSVGALQNARELVRWAFTADVGDVSESFSIDNQFVVGTVTKELKEGLQDATTARPGAESIIRNEKKAAIIIKKTGENPTLGQAAAAYNKMVTQAGMDSSITMSSQIINQIGVEPRVIGAAFNPDFKTKPSPAFAGNSGVFVIQVANTGRKADDTPDLAAQQVSSKIATLRTQTGNWYEGLKKLAEIKDKRSEIGY